MFCKHCGLEFPKSKRCKPCAVKNAAAWKKTHREQALAWEREWRSKNKEQINARQRAWAKAHPEKQKQWKRNFYYANQQKMIDDAGTWSRSHPEETKRSKKKWAHANRPRLCVLSNARRVRQLEAPGSHTLAEWQAIVEAQNGKCFDCGEEHKLTRGHMIPLTRGGSDYAYNIVGQCISCNSRQSTKIHGALTCNLWIDRMEDGGQA